MGLLKSFWAIIRGGYSSSPQASDGPAGEIYSVYTRQYDLEVSAVGLNLLLPKASLDASKGWLEANDFEWSRAVESASAFFDRQEVLRDNLRDELSNLQNSLDLKNVSVAIVIDQSGSMKGDNIAYVAATVRSLADCLTSAGASVELLGYSTAGWHGGFARRDWIAAGRPVRPGRLCCLMHIIYKSADENYLNEQSWQMMLNPDILRENIDGEALLWGAQRLRLKTANRKILLVVSDGAPVDDSTLSENGPSYLSRHATAVIGELENGSEIELAAIGVGYDVDRYYRRSIGAANLGNLFAMSATFLREILCSKEKFPETLN